MYLCRIMSERRHVINLHPLSGGQVVWSASYCARFRMRESHSSGINWSVVFYDCFVITTRMKTGAVRVVVMIE